MVYWCIYSLDWITGLTLTQKNDKLLLIYTTNNTCSPLIVVSLSASVLVLQASPSIFGLIQDLTLIKFLFDGHAWCTLLVLWYDELGKQENLLQ